ncbi:TonB family protein [Burkholderia sp. Ch1-1]|uniref:TonB family protein n=1 Tax=Paraburkholderia dioscoreae TaxID=2604047 RepID=A0A5Q4ZMY6_9BURK|nr:MULTISPECIES: energy transducer TonB [Paraburkholderia]EIF33071.1 TonB family protein [Burkholderia sp. Ch1-1]MDR8401374.1 energy transducer TonB [Paraburkholderia sp. USG1]VVD31888.1 TonB family protein [Paraburkholderia dioscoreae]
MMLERAMATAGYTANDAAWRRRIVVALGAVVAAHVGLLAWVSATRDRTLERTVEAPAIVAMLLRNEPEVAAPAVPAPAAVVAAPQAAQPPARSKLPPPRLKAPRSSIAPALGMPATPTPSRDTARSPEPTTPPVAATPSPAAPATNTPATAAEHTAPASTTPKSVSHVDCDIPKPDYPDVSKRRNESGTAIVRFVVGLSGHIETAQLQKSSGYPRLDDAALSAVHAGACQPYRENGEAVRAAYSESFVFGLTE